MTLSAAIDAYVAVKRSLGAIFTVDERILRSFWRALGDVPVEAISTEQCLAFCRGKGVLSRFTVMKHERLRGFLGYLVGRGHLVTSPLPEPPPRIQSAFRPHIYSHDQIKALLDATAMVDVRSLVAPLTLRTLILLFYGTGLRASEALRLRCRDVDCAERLITVWDTKFFKSRFVPIGATLAEALVRYQREGGVSSGDGQRSHFFLRKNATAIPLDSLDVAFSRLRKWARVRRPYPDPWQPRIHDLRATFAVHRLIAWYREGRDVQRLLPALATYLGHINVSSTQAYLTMTPELLREASLHFERYASPRA